MSIYRYEARTSYGTFRHDTPTNNLLWTVVYVGEAGRKAETQRRQRDREGLCFGWATDIFGAHQLASHAMKQGKLHVFIGAVTSRRRLPSRTQKPFTGKEP